MNALSPLAQWLITSLFWLGALVLIIGIVFIVAPGWAVNTGNNFNRWISTKEFFDSLDRPRYQERWIYRHHLISGAIIIAVVCYVLYTFLIALGIKINEQQDPVTQHLVVNHACSSTCPPSFGPQWHAYFSHP